MTLLRLALATGILLLPGAVVARALGLRGVSVTLVWSLTMIFGALAVTFAVGGSLGLTLVLLLAREHRRAALHSAALPVPSASAPAAGGRWVVGIGLGVLLWWVAGEIGGDGLFHLARVRKLEALDSLSLDAVNEFADGGLHPGYAFPLWHGFLALVARVSFLDPADVVLHEASVLAPLAVVVAYEAGHALFRRVGPARGRRLRSGGGDRARADARRRLHRARAAGDGDAAAPRACHARARVRVRRPADTRPARLDRGRRARAGRRPPDLRDLPLAAVRRVPRRPLARAARRVEEDRDGAGRARRTGGRLPGLAPARRSGHGFTRSREGRAAAGLPAVRGPARRLLRRELPPCARGLRTRGRGRDRRAPLRAARRARSAPALGVPTSSAASSRWRR